MLRMLHHLKIAVTQIAFIRLRMVEKIAQPIKNQECMIDVYFLLPPTLVSAMVPNLTSCVIYKNKN